MKLTGSQIFVEVLVEQGVDTLFGYPGGAVLNLYDELYKNQDRIHHYMSAHEQGASHAADGYARATGKTGVVLATSGPGATNLVTGIATAYMDSVPMVAFTGNVGTAGLGKDSFQEAYIEGITMPITKHNYTVRHVEDLAEIMREAFRIAQSGRKGPVLVDIPKDITTASCEFTPAQPVQPVIPQECDRVSVKQAAELLKQAKRPIIYFGGGVILAGADQELKEVMAKGDIPATWTLMAKGTLEDEDPLNLGLIGMHGSFVSNKAIDTADVVLAVGTRFSDRVALNPKKFAKEATIIQFDIDASEVDKNVEVDLSVVGDAKVALKALLEEMEATTHPQWKEEIAKWKAADYTPSDSSQRLKPHQILETICNEAGDDSIYVTDVGQHQMWAAQYLTHVKPRHFLTSGGLGTMGYGYGAAIGAQIAKGKQQRVIHLTGDGSFHMNLNEAVTAVSYNLPIITVIFNNQVLGMVRQWQTLLYGKRYSSTDPQRKTNYVKLAEGFGAKGWHCETPQEFEAALKEALKNDGPSWIECVIEKDEKVLPMIPAGATIEDIILADGKEAE
ncbi:MAG: biosynthetic-type acetolactate synthase large subunit [Solobacterium sp.]|nr:biosynthetic-type acetolactate synthase large subunit [Solobacterium sp.]